MKRPSLPSVFSGLLLVCLMLFGFAASAARLEVDRQEMAVGEITTVHLKGAPFIAVVDWKVSPELEIVDSDSKRVRVRGARAGAGKVTCEMNLGVHTLEIAVRGAPTTSAPPAPPPVYTPPAGNAPTYTAPSYSTPGTAAPLSNLAGTWQINAAGYQGRLELSNAQGMLIGRVWFDAHSIWEPLRELYFDEAIGELSFIRPGANQAYRGRLRGNTLEGKFAQGSGDGYSANAATYPWSATRSGMTATTAPIAATSNHANLTLNRDRFAPGEAITVNFTAPDGYAGNAWIGILPSQVPHGSEAENDRHDLAYQYLQKRTSGSMAFTAPAAPGNYDLRMHDTDDNGREVASVSFQVGAVSHDGGRGHTAQAPSAAPSTAPRSDDNLKDVVNQLKGLFGR